MVAAFFVHSNRLFFLIEVYRADGEGDLDTIFIERLFDQNQTLVFGFEIVDGLHIDPKEDGQVNR